MKLRHSLLLFFFASAPLHAGPSLYKTGPDEPSAYVRFVNVGSHEILLGKVAKSLPLNQATPFQTVRAGRPIEGLVKAGAQQIAIEDSLPEGGFLTLVLGSDGEPISKHAFLDEVSDFSAQRASITLYNASTACPAADLKVQGRDLKLVQDVTSDTFKRRQLNPADLALEVACMQGKPIQVPPLGLIKAGERYSLILYQNASAELAVLSFKDTMQD